MHSHNIHTVTFFIKRNRELLVETALLRHFFFKFKPWSIYSRGVTYERHPRRLYKAIDIAPVMIYVILLYTIL